MDSYNLWNLWLLLPGILAAIVHMYIVTHNYFPTLAVPLHRDWFGSNKTWRGFIVVPTVGTLIAPFCLGFLNNIPLSLLVGLTSSLGYMLCELPNSALKRKLGVAPGQQHPRHRLTFIFLDQIDSAIGISLGCVLPLHLGLSEEVLLIGMFIVSAMLIKNCLYLSGLKKTRF